MFAKLSHNIHGKPEPILWASGYIRATDAAISSLLQPATR